MGGGGKERRSGVKRQEIARDYRLNVFIENRFARDTFVDRTYVRGVRNSRDKLKRDVFSWME